MNLFCGIPSTQFTRYLPPKFYIHLFLLLPHMSTVPQPSYIYWSLVSSDKHHDRNDVYVDSNTATLFLTRRQYVKLSG